MKMNTLGSLGSRQRKSGGSDMLGNRRKSNHQYIADLRINNAKLATSLAHEKNKYCKIFQCYTGLQRQLTDQQTELRAIAGTAKAGLQKFQAALDLMIEASDLICTVNQKIGILCPELGSIQQPSLPSQSTNSNSVVGEPSPRPPSTPVRAINHSGGVSIRTGSTGNSTAIHGTARPMIQGQVISTHPTISLQRVSVPVSLGRGTQRAPPARGVQLTVEDNVSSRLSDISEESNESTGREIPHTSSINVSLDSATLPSLPMPESHVLLERLHQNESEPSASPDDEFTAVIFGSYSFSNSLPPCKRSISPRKISSPKKLSLSADREEDSSSEDESIAVQIVESKRSYLEPKRQLEFKEGTSWNYDEAGKYHKHPPRKRNSKQSKSINNESLKDTPNRGKKVVPPDNSNVSRVSKSPEKSEISETPGSEKVSAVSSPNLSSSFTVCEDVNMSLTECLTSNIQVFQELSKNAKGEGKKDDVAESLATTRDDEEENRNIFVTKRGRRKKCQDDFDFLNESSGFSQLNTSRNAVLTCVENNENSPPPQAACDSHSHHNETTPKKGGIFSPQSFVLLERLPSYYIFGTEVNIREKTSSPEKAIGHEETKCAPTRNSASKYSSGSPSRKRALSETQGSCEEKVTQMKRNKSKPGPKQFKQQRSNKDETVLELPPTCSAPSSPCSSRNEDSYILRTEANSREKAISPEEAIGQDSSKCAPTRNSASKYSSGSPSRKRAVSETQSSCEEKVTQMKRNKSKPGPKQFKQQRSNKDETVLELPPTCSAPSSPCSSRNEDISECESVDCEDNKKHRPRRNAAPVNLKEPKLGTKLRR